MINFHNKKTKKMVGSIIVIILVIAMIVPILAYFS